MRYSDAMQPSVSRLRSIAYHREIASKFSDALLQHATVNLARAEHNGTTDPRYIARWRALLAQPRDVVIAALHCDDDVMHDLRSCSPFAGALSPRRRWQLFRAATPTSPR